MNEQMIDEYMNTVNQILAAQSEVIESLAKQVEEQQAKLQQVDDRCRSLEYMPAIRMHYLKAIDRAKLDYEIERASSSDAGNAAKPEGRERNITVSLTSFPRRMHELKYTLYSLTGQTLRPDRIVLWLADEEFPHHEDDIAPSLMSLIEKWNITIGWTSNERSYKKLIPSLKAYPDDIIVTADDDAFYADDWLETLVSDYKEHGCIVAHRAQRMVVDDSGVLTPSNTWPFTRDGSEAFCNVATGVGGVLYPPNCFYQDVTDSEKYLRLSPTADDLWFWAMAVLGGHKIRKTDEPLRDIIYINPIREFSRDPADHLMADNVIQNGNDRQLLQLINEYPSLAEIIGEEAGDHKASIK